MLRLHLAKDRKKGKKKSFWYMDTNYGVSGGCFVVVDPCVPPCHVDWAEGSHTQRWSSEIWSK